MSDKLLEIVQDHTSIVQAIRLILEAEETKKLQQYATLYTFKDSIIDDQVRYAIEYLIGYYYCLCLFSPFS